MYENFGHCALLMILCPNLANIIPMLGKNEQGVRCRLDPGLTMYLWVGLMCVSQTLFELNSCLVESLLLVLKNLYQLLRCT